MDFVDLKYEKSFSKLENDRSRFLKHIKYPIFN